MSIYTTDTCFGCQVTIERESGTYYCNACIAAQYAELSAERQAFEDFHAYADQVARVDRHHLATPVYRRDWTDERGPTVPQGAGAINDTLAASADAIARTERLMFPAIDNITVNDGAPYMAGTGYRYSEWPQTTG